MNSAATLSGPKRLREAEPLIHFDVARVRSFVIPQHDWISPAPRTPTPAETPTAFSEIVCPKTAAEHASMPSTVATKKVARNFARKTNTRASAALNAGPRLERERASESAIFAM